MRLWRIWRLGGGGRLEREEAGELVLKLLRRVGELASVLNSA